MKYSLKELRARYNYTQLEMAEMLGVSTQTYNAWENNVGIIKLSYALKICEIFNVSMSELKVE